MIYACPDGREATYIRARECDHNVNSEAAYSKIRSWIADCDDRHSCCPRQAPMPLPTRVLDLNDPYSVKLRETQSERGQYAALSYCWGKKQQSPSLTSSSRDSFTNLQISSLPLTIQDAIRVTRQIGLRYLWVDALCIIQDSKEDKDTEIARMAEYYQSASITIFAASASGSDQGFLASTASARSREPDAASYQFQLSIALPDGTVGIVGAEYCIWENKVSPEPLDHRAWAYQEHLLCRRALTYGTSTLTWRCEEGLQTWTSWLRMHQKEVTKLLPKRQSPYVYKEAWKGMVAIYSSRNLTFPEDKLPAISALASQVFHISVENGGEPGKYLAGVWENDLHDQLLWLTSLVESRDVRCIPYLAPSWSWASVECNVVFLPLYIDLGAGGIENAKSLQLEIIDCSVTPRCSLLPLGQVTASRLRVRGCLVYGASIPDPENWLLGRFNGTKGDIVLKLDGYGVGDGAAILKAQSCWWLQVQHQYWLVLEPVDGDIYRRVGCVVFPNWSEFSGGKQIIDLI
ncbi:hypothetical protein NM208_g12629 [Fusarium decemcellulare]|uniref:Uncharacterized protein n=1 Tax=Fusarium decemcellulare TaxID=57161 RepID=A0ACC1RPM6_9HYPO|nr:hypothetical protein NM208_g12629 [Fusarium decemcellulare]